MVLKHLSLSVGSGARVAFCSDSPRNMVNFASKSSTVWHTNVTLGATQVRLSIPTVRGRSLGDNTISFLNRPRFESSDLGCLVQVEGKRTSLIERAYTYQQPRPFVLAPGHNATSRRNALNARDGVVGSQ
ncbi:hypothetical protein DFH06DRAFT_1145946 [Mycena polygramma]|nr:hypothetical protein DFH06DRAFT_1145946 [Mycena polygramma]